MNDIKQLLDKFFNGETSLEEETQLKEFFRDENLPEEFIMLKYQFEFYEKEKSSETLGEEFDELILNRIGKEKIIKLDNGKKKNAIVKLYWYRAVGIAATFLLIFGIYTIFNETDKITETKIEYSTKDIETFNKTIEALALAGKYIDMSNKKLEKLSIINQAFEKLDKVSYIDKYNNYIFNYLGEKS